MTKLWVVSYDIKNDRIRRRVHDILRNHGEKVQYSVFECRLNKRQFEVLRSLVRAELDEDDSVRWYPLCKWCVSRVICHGRGLLPEYPGYYMA